MITIAAGVFAGIVGAVWFLGWCAARQERRAMALLYPPPPKPPREQGAWLGMVAMVGIIFVFRAFLAVTGIMP